MSHLIWEEQNMQSQNVLLWHMGCFELNAIKNQQIQKVKKKNNSNKHFSSVQFSRSVVSYSLRPHERQHARPPCPTPTTGVHPDSCPSSRWCHPAISSSVVPFSSCPQSLPASEAFPMSQLFAWGGQRIRAPALVSVLPKNTQDWSPLGWTGWISLQSKGLARVFSNTTVQKHQFFGAQLSSQSNSHPYMTTGKTIALTRQNFVGKVMSLLFNMLSRLVITFLPRSKRLLISWLQSPSAVISLVAQRLKRLPAMWETWVRSLGWEDPLEKEMATHSSILAWRIPWMEEPGGLQSMGLQRVRKMIKDLQFKTKQSNTVMQFQRRGNRNTKTMF